MVRSGLSPTWLTGEDTPIAGIVIAVGAAGANTAGDAPARADLPAGVAGGAGIDTEPAAAWGGWGGVGCCAARA